MHSNQFRRTRVAAAVAGLALALGAGQAFGAAFALQEQSVSGLGQRLRRRRRRGGGRQHGLQQSRRHVALSTAQVVAGLNIITPSIKFNDSGSLPAFNQPLGGSGGDAGAHQLRAEPLPRGADQHAIRVRPGHRRAVRPRHRMGRRLARPLPGDQIRHQDDQRQSGGVVAHRPRTSRSVSASTTSRSRRRSPATSTTPPRWRQARKQAAAGGLIPPTSVGAVHPGHAGTRFIRQHQRRRLAPGAGIWASCWDITPDMRVGAHYRSSIKYNINGNASFNNPALAAAAPAGADRRGDFDRASTPALVQQRRDGEHQGAVDRQRVVLRALNPKWDVMADVQCTDWSTIQDLHVRAHQRRAAAVHAGEFQGRRGDSRSARATTSTTSGSSAAASRTISRRCRTSTGRRACRTQAVPGCRLARSTRCRRTSSSTADSRTSGAERHPSTRTRAARRNTACSPGKYKASVTIFGVPGTYSF